MVIGGCVYKDISELADQTPIEAVDKPSSLLSGSFATVIVGYRSSDATGQPISRVAAGGGPGQGHVVFGVWDGAARRGLDPLFDGCEQSDECDPGAGADLTFIERWGEERGCLVSSSVTGARLRVQCETSPALLNGLNTPPPETGGMGFGMAIDGVAAAAGGVGNEVVLVVGAPGAATETGALYEIMQDDPNPRGLSIDPDAALLAGAQLGTELATARASDGSVVIVAAAPGVERVVVFRRAADGADSVLETLGCFDGIRVGGPAETGTATLEVADLTGDGLAEVILGEPSRNVVRYASIGTFSGADGCADPSQADDPATATIGCADIPAKSVQTCAELGASLATGDVDADGFVDLVVGAPGSSVDGHGGAGAVYTLVGGATGLRPEAGVGLGLANASTEARLGERVATVPSHLQSTPRSEVVAAAPGTARLYLFWCSGVASDQSDSGDRCIEGM